MAQTDTPFESFSFTLIADKKPRRALRLTTDNDGMFELHVERGSASNPTSQFTRLVPLEVVLRLRDALQEIGVFTWEESYGDSAAPGSMRWNVTTVFKQDVFSVTSKGGSDAPLGFDALLEELYRLDFPRFDDKKEGKQEAAGLTGMSSALNMLGSMGMGNIGGLSAGDLGAYHAAGQSAPGIDFSQLGEMFSQGDMADMFADIQRNPQAFEQRMKEEFRHMSAEEQNQMLDMLASTGMATREWWERFLRGL